MGIGGISATSLGLILLIVIIVFGTKKLRTIGKDLGEGVKSFRKGLEESSEKTTEREENPNVKSKDKVDEDND